MGPNPVGTLKQMTTSIDLLFEQSGLSIAEVAERSGLSAARVDAIVCGRWLPSPQQREAMAKALQVKVDRVDWGHTMSPRNIRYHRFGLKEDFS